MESWSDTFSLFPCPGTTACSRVIHDIHAHGLVVVLQYPCNL